MLLCLCPKSQMSYSSPLHTVQKCLFHNFCSALK